jgi:hypothetical protein
MQIAELAVELGCSTLLAHAAFSHDLFSAPVNAL